MNAKTSSASILVIATMLAVAVSSLCGQQPAHAGPVLRSPPSLSPKAMLGKALFFDTTLSTPVGQSCSSCHSPATGFTFPDSQVNQQLGVAPGVIPGRFGFRDVPQASYAAYIPIGPPKYNRLMQSYVGGMFWDGRATDLTNQATFPFQNPNEMNNLTHNVGDPSLVVQSVAQGPSASLFKSIYGSDIFTQPVATAFADITDAIAEYEKSSEVSPFSSKYDAWRAGLAQLSPAELDGLRILTGSWTGRPGGAPYGKFAQCVSCHGVPSDPSSGPDLWTNACFANIGVPRNLNNPYYAQTDPVADPVGFNPDGAAFVDLGLGDFLYPQMGLPSGNTGPGSDGNGDFLAVNGSFKAPSFRNVDLRPSPTFVKAYMHNGVFKTLEDVVHFYNTRNLTTIPGELIDFGKADPYAGLKGTPLWPPPEYASPDTLQNPSGDPGNTALPGITFGEGSAQVGNLILSPDDEAHIVAFLQTLSDGYFDPAAAFSNPCNNFVSQPVSQNSCLTGQAIFTVATTSTEPLTYQWQRGNPPAPVSGATSAFFPIFSVKLSDAGAYSCVVTGSCGSITSLTAQLTICIADFDCSGRVTVQDIFSFLTAWFASNPQADVNGSGVVDVHDIYAFLRAWFQGC